ncbi:hypothetical protein [Actinobacillus minor]|uniref:hypothetical protein n=1 Tax=Actinobacillus minor TaxID=51047 RepID=UPI0026EFCD44|nr:hypothetical protein [Actinobacillus minor]
MAQLEKGINLTAFHQEKWGKTHANAVIKLLLTGFFSMLVFSMTFIHQQNTTAKQLLLVDQIQQKKRMLSQLEQKIEQSKYTHTLDLSTLLDAQLITKFNYLIQQVPIKSGGISDIRFYNENGTKIKIIGKYEKQQELSTLEDFLEEKGFSIKVENLQTNEKSKTEFSLIITQKNHDK